MKMVTGEILNEQVFMRAMWDLLTPGTVDRLPKGKLRATVYVEDHKVEAVTKHFVGPVQITPALEAP
jgi:hypothetical protein